MQLSLGLENLNVLKMPKNLIIYEHNVQLDVSYLSALKLTNKLNKSGEKNIYYNKSKYIYYTMKTSTRPAVYNMYVVYKVYTTMCTVYTTMCTVYTMRCIQYYTKCTE